MFLAVVNLALLAYDVTLIPSLSIPTKKNKKYLNKINICQFVLKIISNLTGLSLNKLNLLTFLVEYLN